MLDLDHPQAAHRFAAAIQLDLICDYHKRITTSDRAGRLFKLEIIRPSFVALRWLNAERFEGSPAIAASLAELETKTEELACLGPRETRRWSGDPPEVC